MRSSSRAVLIVIFVLGLSAASAAQSVEETLDVLESAVTELQSSVDDLEQYRSGLEDEDLTEALHDVREARSTMRSVAISLLIGSVDVRRAGDFDRVKAAIRMIMPELGPALDGERPKLAATPPPKSRRKPRIQP